MKRFGGPGGGEIKLLILPNDPEGAIEVLTRQFEQQGITALLDEPKVKVWLNVIREKGGFSIQDEMGGVESAPKKGFMVSMAGAESRHTLKEIVTIPGIIRRYYEPSIIFSGCCVHFVPSRNTTL